MNNHYRNIRITLIIVFSAIGILSFSLFAYWILLSVFGFEWEEKTFVEIAWKFKGFLVLGLFSVITSFALIKNRKNEIVFGFSIPIGLLLYFFLDITKYSLNYHLLTLLNEQIWPILYILALILIFIGLIKMRNKLDRFKPWEYIAVGLLALSLFLSLNFMDFKL